MRWTAFALVAMLAGCSGPIDQGITLEEADLVVQVPGQDAQTHTVAFDPATYPAAAFYTHLDAEHPGYFTVHDLLQRYRMSGGEYGHEARDGAIRLTAVDGLVARQTVTQDSSWNIEVNGAPGNLLSKVAPRDTVTVTFADRSGEPGFADLEVTYEETTWTRRIHYSDMVFPAAQLYQGRDVRHPGFFTVHDLLEVAARGEFEYETDYFSGLGFLVVSIFRVEMEFAPDFSYGAFWELSRNGQEANGGINMSVASGDTITFEYVTFGEPPEEDVFDVMVDDDNDVIVVVATGSYTSWDALIFGTELEGDALVMLNDDIIPYDDEEEGYFLSGPMAIGDTIAICSLGGDAEDSIVAIGDYETDELLFFSFMDIAAC